MTCHFEKLQTPLRCITKYPSLQHQRRRFLDLGWDQVAACNLWDLWRDSRFLNYEERVALNDVEPFDEWEEFALFASHYFVAVAVKVTDVEVPIESIGLYLPSPMVRLAEHEVPEAVERTRYPNVLQYQDNPKGRGRRRFGAAIRLANRLVGCHGGLGPQSRMNSTDVYADGETEDAVWNTPPVSVAVRMCHTVTALDNTRSLLVGGRMSPANALGDCWLQHRESWEQVHDLPLPRYRHCATRLFIDSSNPAVLVSGGKSSEGTVLADYIVWRADSGWQNVQVNGVAPGPRFGASMITVENTSGILLGGMSEDGIILSDCWHWFVDVQDESVTITFLEWKLRSPFVDRFPSRFGASIEVSRLGLLMMGGISDRGLIPQESEIVRLRPDTRKTLELRNGVDGSVYVRGVELLRAGNRPLLVGHSTITLDASTTLIIGGGAVCFSFGTHWNTGIWTLQSYRDLPTPKWHICDVSEVNLPARSGTPATMRNEEGDRSPSDLSTEAVGRVRVATSQAFETIVTKAKPVIMGGLDIGSCIQTWTTDYLRDAVGPSRQVCSHGRVMLLRMS